ncbi:MAG: DNA-binding transcriptional regulator Fis [Gammaproteobacteria bacterium]|nr:DNA-binding transcriptional regulator Fis [Gammaproteobacteria bacterium]
MTGIPAENTIENEFAQSQTVDGTTSNIQECVQESMETYFSNLDGHGTNELYKMVIGEVEQPLLRVVLKHTRGNQTRAAEILGINRGTLRKKLKMYDLG